MPVTFIPERISSKIKFIPDNKQRGFGEEVLRQVGRTGRTLATGISGLADVPNIAAAGLHAAGLREKPEFYPSVSGNIQRGIDTLTGGYLKPENEIEEWVDWLGESAAPLALAPVTGGSSLTGVAAKSAAKRATNSSAKKYAEKLATFGSESYKPTAKNIAGTLGSSAALKNYIDTSDNPDILGSLGYGMLGGHLGKSGVGITKGFKNLRHPIESLKNKAALHYGQSKQFNPEKYAQYEELGLSPTLGRVSNSPKVQSQELSLANTANGMGHFNKANENLGIGLARNLGIKNVENAQDLKNATRNIDKSLAQQGAQQYENRISKLYEQRGEKFEPRVYQAKKNRERIDIGDIQEDLKKGQLGLETDAEKELFNKTPQGRYLNQLNKLASQESQLGIPQIDTREYSKNLKKQGYPQDLIEKMISKISSKSSENPSEISYAALDALRHKALHESNTPLSVKSESRDLKNIHYGLSGERHEFMEKNGTPSEKHNAREARKLWSKYASKDKSNMQKYVTELTDSKSDKEAFSKVFNDPKYARAVVHGLLKKHGEQRIWTETVITHLGNDNGRFKATTAYNKFKNIDPSIQNELLKGFNKSEKNCFSNTMNLIGENKEYFDKMYNTSRSAYVGKDLAMNEELKRNAIKAVLGNIKSAGLVVANLTARMGDSLASKAMTDPIWLRRVNNVMTSKNKKAISNNLDLMFKNKYARKAVKGLSTLTREIGRSATHYKDLN